MSNEHQHNATAPPAETVAGTVARFSGPEALLEAARRVRQAGYRYWDCHSPYPVHGLERTMGVRPTVLPWLVLGGGLAGAAGALLLQWWTNAVDYPFVASGKPLFSLPANIPITFELLVLLAAFAAFGGALGLSLLPQFAHPVFLARRFVRVTTDGFFVSVEAADPKFHEADTPEFLRSLGAVEVEVCRLPAAGQAVPRAVYWGLGVAAVLALLPPLGIAWSRQRDPQFPRNVPKVRVMKDMVFQPKYRPQTPSPLFDDDRDMRPAVPGAVAHETSQSLSAARYEHWHFGQIGGKDADTFPMPVSKELILRGQERYDIYCATCHGLTGEAGVWDGMTSRRARKRGDPGWVPPAALTGDNVRNLPVGKIFSTITDGMFRQGSHTMPSYAAQIPVEDRWAIVLYVRALQRARVTTPAAKAPAAKPPAAQPPAAQPPAARGGGRGTRNEG